MGRNTAEITKNICCAKDEGEDGYSNQIVEERQEISTTIKQGQIRLSRAFQGRVPSHRCKSSE